MSGDPTIVKTFTFGGHAWAIDRNGDLRRRDKDGAYVLACGVHRGAVAAWAYARAKWPEYLR